MAEKSIGERCRREANVGSPAPGKIVLRELKLDVMKFNPVSLSSPFDGLPFASEKDTERFCQCHGKERVLRPGVQKRGLEAARSHGPLMRMDTTGRGALSWAGVGACCVDAD